jgi:hypothetical protein
VDEATAAAIEAFEPQSIGPQQACGNMAIGGLLDVAARRRLEVSTLDLRTSGDTAGDRDRVVGYGAWAFTQPVAG